MNIKKIKIGIIGFFVLSLSSLTLSFSDTLIIPEDIGNLDDLKAYSKAFLLSDLTEDNSLISYNEDTKLGIASLSKLMTLNLLLEDLESGKANLTDYVTISSHALSQDGNGLKLKLGDQVSVDDLMHGMLICSSNDAAVALAEYMSGSESAFVERMNQSAKDLGLSSASFVNASGLTDYSEAKETRPNQNVMNVSDLYKLTRHLIETYPSIRDITSLQCWNFEAKQIEKNNTNLLLETIPEVNGFKTGFTNFAGYCQVTTATFDYAHVDTDIVDGMTRTFNNPSSKADIAAVVLGATSKYQKNQITTTLINYLKQNCTLFALTTDSMPIYDKTVELPEGYAIFASKDQNILYGKDKTIDYSVVYDPYWKRSPAFLDNLPIGKIIFYDGNHYLISVDLVLRQIQ